MNLTRRFACLSACFIGLPVLVFPGVAADAGAGPGPKPDAASKPVENTYAASLAVSATGVTEVWLHVDARSRGVRPLSRWNRDIRFGLKLRGSGPAYHEFEIKGHGSDQKPAEHLGKVTIDPKHQWVVIDLHEVVSKPGEPRRTEPCAANGRYPVEVVNRGNAGWQNHQGLMTPNSGPTPAELAVPIIPNGPSMQPR